MLPGKRDEEDEDPDPTVPEELDFASVQRQHLKFERTLQRRQSKRTKQVAAVDEQAQRVAEQQRELNRSKEVADATHAQVLECSAAVARMSARLAQLAA